MTALIFEPWSDPLALYLARNMRASDAAEIFAQRADRNPFALYRDMAALRPRHLWFEIVRERTEVWPVALFGVVQTGPGVGTAHMFGTPGLSLGAARIIAGRIRSTVIPAMIEKGMHRVEALSLTDYHWAHRFMRRAGARVEGTRLRLGSQGEDFTCFVWLKEEMSDVYNPED